MTTPLSLHHIACILLFLNLCLPTLEAATKKPQLHPIQMPARETQWTLKITYPDYPKITGQPIQLNVSRDANGLVYGQIIYSDKSAKIFYIDRNIILQKAANTGRVISWPARQAEINDPYNLITPIFPGTGWITAKDLEGQEPVKGGLLNKYVRQIPGSNARTYRAWIDSATHHPVKVDLGDRIYEFSGIEPLERPLPIPSEFSDALDKLVENPNKER